MKKGNCKLCLKYKDLCKESHIIPMFMYKHITGDNNKLVFLNNQQITNKFNGEYEGSILCENCDSVVIGKLETYASRFIEGQFPSGILPGFEHKNGRDLVVIENDPYYNYSTFKLFLLSLMWRASISSRPFFSQIKLPQEFEEDLRQRILNQQPGEPDLYSCFINLPPITTDQQGRTGFHTFYMPTKAPIYMENGDLRICEFIIEGVHYYFIITRPSNMNVEPGINKNKLILGISTVDEQNEIISQIIEYTKKHQIKQK